MDAEVTLPVLPKGFTLPHAGGRAGYKLLALEVQALGLNVYRAYDLAPSRRCPACANLEAAESAVCRACGADLAQAVPSNAVVFLYEGAEGDRLEPGLDIHLAGLRHPHLLLPLYAQRISFTDGTSRSYLLTPERPAPALADLPAPHGVLTVLRWGLQLSQALAQLQAAGLRHGEVDLRHVLARPDRAWLACDPAEAPSAHAPSRGRDVQQLARVLLYALTGSDDPAGLAAVPPPVGRALEAGLITDAGESAPADRFAGALTAAAEEVSAWTQARSNAAWITDPGQRRLDNEDSLGVLTLDFTCAGVRTNAGVYVVADGAGGMAAGELASRAAVEAVMSHLAPAVGRPLTSPGPGMAEVKAAFAEANTAVRRLRAGRGEKLATTLTVLLVAGLHATVAHVGDTRLYRWDGRALEQVTRDHTLGRHQLERALGGTEVVEPDVHELDLAPDDVLLLCSDGLHGEVADAQIAEILLAYGASLNGAAQALLDAANAAGGRDNISAILVRSCDRSAPQ